MENNVISKQLVLNKYDYYETHLNIVNSVLPEKLTSKEIQVFSRFMAFEGDIATDRFGTSARKIVKEELKLSDGGLGNYLKIFKDKGLILTNEVTNKLYLNPILEVNNKEQVYVFKITKE